MWGLLLGLLTLTSHCHAYCSTPGANPWWTGPPQIEQVSLTSVRVSWDKLLERPDCADSMLVKHFKGTYSSDFKMTEPMEVATNSYIVMDLVPMVDYTFQVIAREEKGILGVDYNRSPKTVFRTRSTNPTVKRNDPLPVTAVTHEVAREDEDVAVEPVYDKDQAEKQVVDTMSLELLVGIAIGVLVCVVIFAGIIYNCSKRKNEDKDLELESSIGDEDEEEEDEDDDETEEDYPKEERKYQMVLEEPKINNEVTDTNTIKLLHSQSIP